VRELAVRAAVRRRQDRRAAVTLARGAQLVRDEPERLVPARRRNFRKISLVDLITCKDILAFLGLTQYVS
jgi:hypothetical protein